jgi:hypothetical protein
MEDTIVAITSVEVNHYGDHRFDGRPGEHDASRESVQSSDYMEKNERK